MNAGAGFFPRGVLGILPNGVGSPALVIRKIVDNVWQTGGNTQNSDFGVTIIKIESQGETPENCSVSRVAPL